MAIQYIRGWIGLIIFAVSIVLWFLEPTRLMAPLATGFGIGMMSSGFN